MADFTEGNTHQISKKCKSKGTPLHFHFRADFSHSYSAYELILRALQASLSEMVVL